MPPGISKESGGCFSEGHLDFIPPNPQHCLLNIFPVYEQRIVSTTSFTMNVPNQKSLFLWEVDKDVALGNVSSGDVTPLAGMHIIKWVFTILFKSG